MRAKSRPVAAGYRFHAGSSQHPFNAARFGWSDLDGKTSLDCLMKILHEFFHAVALRSATWNRGDFGPKAALFRFMHDDFDLHD